ncbi:MAG: zinc metalloprotease HtpX [Chloroflexi bacterium]|nr:zinc metalloprotease HtpX [Chloroflexota bacterium]
MISSLGTFTSQLKTFVLLAALGGLLVAVGGLIGGQTGLVIALVLALVMNVGVYWFSDKVALKANGARPMQPGEAPQVERIVQDLSGRARIPMPALYLIDRPEPNAFATGRSPKHAAVAVTTGLLAIMDERQLRGVLAHELSHVTNRDMLVGTIAATIGGAISFLGNMALWSSMFGGGDDGDGVPAPVLLLSAILAPIAATIIQLSVSRTREYGADRSGALLTHDPEGLASALETLDAASRQLQAQRGRFGRRRGQQQPVPAAMAHLYTVSPLGGSAGSLFSTHPPIAERVRRLRSFRTV